MDLPHKTNALRNLFCFGLILINSLVFGQEKATLLKKDSKLESDIKTGETHSYNVKMSKEQFFFATVNQMDIDLMINTYDEKGNKLETIDSPNGRNGIEPVTLITKTAGLYRIDILPLEDNEKEGKYTLEVKRIEPLGTTAEEKIDQLFALWDNQNSPGAAIAMVQNGQIINSKGYGIANLEYNIPITPNSVFHIASVSKQFTAFSIAMLADEGKLSLDDDIRKYLPELHQFKDTITIQHLIHHTSGLRDQWNLLAVAGWRLDDVITSDQIMKLLSNQTELNFKPGDEFVYCNSGFTLLAKIVERVTKTPFPKWTKDHIFEPLGMSSTLFYDDHEKIVKDRAYSYSEAGNGYKKSALNYSNVGATSLFTTVNDLSKWAINFEEPKVGNQRIMELMNQRGILNNGDTIDYAFGQGIGNYKGLMLISHGGADAGYRTYLGRFPDQRFSVIVFSNLGSFNTGGMAMKISDIYLEDFFEKEEIVADADKTEEGEFKDVDISLLKEYTGEYELFPGFILTVSLENNQLKGQATGQPKVDMKAMSDSVFVIPVAGATIIFSGDNDKVSQLLLKQGGQEMKAAKMKAFDRSAVKLNEFTGEFYSKELSTSYTFYIENDTLKARHQRHPDITFTPTKTDFFSGNVWFIQGIEFVRNADKAIIGLKASSGRVRNLWFDKVKGG
jgi:CubicO group peptidase (beta-lactamase class C family)